MYEFCCIDTESFIVHVKTDDIYKDIAKDAKTRLNYKIVKTV